MPDNKKLVIDSGNQWIKDSEIAPFFGFPSWWRRFVFQILTPRELTVYLYICSTMDQNAVSYPTIDQIAGDLDVKSRVTVKAAIERLVELGFLLRSERPIRGRIMSKRYVFQRPAAEHTLLTLLRKNLIDARLYPTVLGRSPGVSSGDEVIAAGLRRLLGTEYYNAYRHVLPRGTDGSLDNVKEVLTHLLETKLQERIIAATPAEPVQNKTARWLAAEEILESLPEHLRGSMRKYLVDTEMVLGDLAGVAAPQQSADATDKVPPKDESEKSAGDLNAAIKDALRAKLRGKKPRKSKT